MALSNKISGRSALYFHLYGFRRDPFWPPPYCKVSEHVRNHAGQGAAVLIDNCGTEITRIMQIVQDEYAIHVLGEQGAYEGTCRDLCGGCPYKRPGIKVEDRPVSNRFGFYDARQKGIIEETLSLDPELISAVQQDPALADDGAICRPRYAVVKVDDLALGEVRLGGSRGKLFRNAFLAVASTTLKSPLIDRLLYPDYFLAANASIANYEIARRIKVF